MKISSRMIEALRFIKEHPEEADWWNFNENIILELSQRKLVYLGSVYGVNKYGLTHTGLTILMDNGG